MTHDHDDPILSACQFYQTTQGREAMQDIREEQPAPPINPTLADEGQCDTKQNIYTLIRHVFEVIAFNGHYGTLFHVIGAVDEPAARTELYQALVSYMVHHGEGGTQKASQLDYIYHNGDKLAAIAHSERSPIDRKEDAAQRREAIDGIAIIQHDHFTLPDGQPLQAASTKTTLLDTMARHYQQLESALETLMAARTHPGYLTKAIADGIQLQRSEDYPRIEHLHTAFTQQHESIVQRAQEAVLCQTCQDSGFMPGSHQVGS